MDKKLAEFNSNLVPSSLVIIAGVLLSFGLYFAKNLAMPFVVAIFIFYLISPLVIMFRSKWGIPRVPAIILTFLLCALFGGLVIFFVSQSISNVISGFDLYQKRVLSLLPQVIDQVNEFGFNLNANQIRTKILELPFFSYIRGAAGAAINFFSLSTLVLIYVIFMVMGSSFSPEPKKSFFGVINKRIRRYITTKLITSSLTGLLVGIILATMGIDFPVMFGVLTLIFNFIPTLGSIVATLLPLPVALLEFGELWKIFLVLAIPGGVQFVIGSIIEPKILGKSLNLHPVTVLLSLIFWGMLWGIPGAFLAVPITAILKIVLENTNGFKTFARALGGELPDFELDE